MGLACTRADHHQAWSFTRLILFDKRGVGLSDRVPETQLPSMETRMDDVRAVMDAAGSERAVVFGVSEGGPMAILFAATYPERSIALMLYGTDPDYTEMNSDDSFVDEGDEYPGVHRPELGDARACTARDRLLGCAESCG